MVTGLANTKPKNYMDCNLISSKIRVHLFVKNNIIIGNYTPDDQTIQNLLINGSLNTLF